MNILQGIKTQLFGTSIRTFEALNQLIKSEKLLKAKVVVKLPDLPSYTADLFEPVQSTCDERCVLSPCGGYKYWVKFSIKTASGKRYYYKEQYDLHSLRIYNYPDGHVYSPFKLYNDRYGICVAYTAHLRIVELQQNTPEFQPDFRLKYGNQRITPEVLSRIMSDVQIFHIMPAKPIY